MGSLTILGAKGIWGGIKQANEWSKEAEIEERQKEIELKVQGQGAWEKHKQKEIRTQRIFWFALLGSISCIIPPLGLIIYMFGFGPYWGNKAANRIGKNINNKLLKYILIGALMIPVGMTTGAFTHMAITSLLGIHPTGQSDNQ